MLEFEWDDDKNALNRAKHGIDFEDAIAIFAGLAIGDKSSASWRWAWWKVSRSPWSSPTGARSSA